MLSISETTVCAIVPGSKVNAHESSYSPSDIVVPFSYVPLAGSSGHYYSVLKFARYDVMRCVMARGMNDLIGGDGWIDGWIMDG